MTEKIRIAADKNKETQELIGMCYQRFCVISAEGKIIRIPDEILFALYHYHEI